MEKTSELTPHHIEKYAEILFWGLCTARSERFRPNDIVMLRFDASALPLAESLHRLLLERKCNVIVRIGLTWTMERNFYLAASSRQLRFQPPGEAELYRHLNGSIYLHGPESLTHLSDVDPKRIGTALVALKSLREILENREEQGLFGWTLCTFPTEELAKRAQISLPSYTEQVITACFLDRDDPLKHWKEIYKASKEIKKWLNSLAIRSYRIEGASLDLTINNGESRQWIGISGHNIPSFELFVSPDWRGARGRYYANQPSYRSGNYVERVNLIFDKGTITAVEAEAGEAFVKKQIAIDRGAGRIGEFSLTDRRFSRIDRFMADTLFDENYGGRYGNCHIALGSSYSDTYAGDQRKLTKALKRRLGFNDSALHWDLVNTEQKRVTALLAGGRHITVYDDGQFAY
ncbi:MAG: aminopeptidase [Deltaproteobacteria bacterium]|nr:aminopeptidase [Deltaproteobacteria bacterium]